VIDYLGFFGEPTGYGEAARRHASALLEVGQPLRPRALRQVRRGRYRSDRVAPWWHLEQAYRQGGRPRVARRIVHTPPPHFPHLAHGRAMNIGMTAWETPHLPRGWADALEHVDEIWVPSHFCRQAFQAATRLPVVVMPHPVAVPPAVSTRGFPGIPDDLLLFGSVLQWSDRKNPDGLVRSFVRAFRGRRDVALALKLGFRLGAARADVEGKLAALTRGFGPCRAPTVFLIGDELDDTLMARFYDRVDVYVSLHRAEGFGLCLAQAMARGKPVVATGYSGNLEFMSDDNAVLIRYRRVDVQQPLTPSWFESTMQWAQPDEDHAIEAMRWCANHPGSCARMGERARLSLVPFRPDAIGERMRRRLGADAASCRPRAR